MGIMDGESFEERVAAVATLHEPLRRRLYELVAGRDEPVSRDEAAAALGVARSVAAFHLDKLAEAGLCDVEFRRTSERSGPGAGRPAKLYRRSALAREVSVPARRYDVAGHLLAQAMGRAGARQEPAADSLHDVAREFGESLGQEARRRAGRRPTRPQVLDAVVEVLAEHGYEPRRDGRTVVLRNCPFHDLAAEHTDLVCGMNRDLLDGLTQGAQAPRIRARLDPASDRCCVVLDVD